MAEQEEKRAREYQDKQVERADRLEAELKVTRVERVEVLKLKEDVVKHNTSLQKDLKT